MRQYVNPREEHKLYLKIIYYENYSHLRERTQWRTDGII
jgi:hypothetical protein